MFLSKIFRREGEPPAKESAGSAEHLAPTRYFTDARIADFRDTLGQLGSLKITSITPLDQ